MYGTMVEDTHWDMLCHRNIRGRSMAQQGSHLTSYGIMVCCTIWVTCRKASHLCNKDAHCMVRMYARYGVGIERGELEH